MKICVLIKQVPNEDAVIKVSPDNSGIIKDNITYCTNEPDTYALEEALSIKDKNNDCEVIVCTMGGSSSTQILKEALAKGADKAIHITHDDMNNLSPLEMAKIITEKIREEKFDLILSGLQSNDFGYAQLGIITSELLKYSNASLVMGTEILSDNKIKVKRELENGWFQWSDLTLPASLTIQSGINSPRYATLKGIMSVKNKEVKEFSKDNIEYIENNSYKVIEKFIPQKSKETKVIDGSADEISDKLVDILKNELRLIS